MFNHLKNSDNKKKTLTQLQLLLFRVGLKAASACKLALDSAPRRSLHMSLCGCKNYSERDGVSVLRGGVFAVHLWQLGDMDEEIELSHIWVSESKFDDLVRCLQPCI